ncbi:DUF5819 family protein [Streptomyces sp. NPDC020807]|uniref:DUF5819 family protein n=1 Tax=Streptomyces sp. NPDC020807 TaxID=3155119 RepID=UPI0033C076EE
MSADVEQHADEVSDGPGDGTAGDLGDGPGDPRDALADDPGGPLTGGPGGGSPPPPAPRTPPSGTGITALSMPYQVAAAVALAVVAVFVCVHLAMVFLHVAPSNTVTKRHGQAVDDWVYPEFEQNWKLFAPNPLQQNVSVEARAEIVPADGGGVTTTGWIDLTAQDTAAIRHNPMPSHTQQNELRRAVDFYLNSHADDDAPHGMRGRLSEEYMRRIAALRLDGLPSLDGYDVRRVQLRTVTRPVPAPRWSTEKNDTASSYRELPWWKVTSADLPGGAAAPGRTEAGR